MDMRWAWSPALGSLGLGLGALCLAAGACSGSANEDLTGAAASGAGAGSTGGGGLGFGGDAGSGGDGAACAVASAELSPTPVDIVFAIDQSASMGEEIAGVIDNVGSNLLGVLGASGIDYRVVFVAGVDGLPAGPELFHADTPVNSSDALTLLLWTYDGDSKAPNTCDKVAEAAVRWRDHLRYESLKVFIVVSDDDPSTFDCGPAAAACTGDCGGCENECAGYCPMYQCPTYADAPAAWGGGDFASELYALEPAGMFGSAAEPKWLLHAIVPVEGELGPSEPLTPLGQVCNANGNTGVTSGLEYQKLAVATGGLRFSSCDTDYSPVFQSIAANIVPLACKFDLEETGIGTPDPAETNVDVDYGDGSGSHTIPRDDTAPCDAGADGWQYTADGKSILLCGAACAALEASDDASVHITVGCEALVK
jgi:hypothetical protein